MELFGAESHLVHDGVYYVKYDWTTAEKSRNKVTDKWVREYMRGPDGDIAWPDPETECRNQPLPGLVKGLRSHCDGQLRRENKR